MTIRDPALEAWASALDEFPLGGNPRDKLAALVPFAILAPSSHNSQPWLFRLTDDTLELRADPERRCPVVDPHDRELIISCGAALGCLEVALHNFGYDGDIAVIPDPGHPGLLARIRLGNDRKARDHDEAMFNALRTRRTNRLPFRPKVLEPGLMDDLPRIAAGFGVWLQAVQYDPGRFTLAELITEGDHIQMADPDFRRELAAWIHTGRGNREDGMPGWALGFNPAESLVLPLVVRTFDTGKGKAAVDRELVLGSPFLAVLGSNGDTPKEWLQTGRALSHILLRAEAEGVAASFLNQPIEVPELRHKVVALLGQTCYPQLILRMGYPEREDRKTPRRAVSEVLQRPQAADRDP